MTDDERQLLLDMLGQYDGDTSGLREQVAKARVVSSCRCGCGSLGFVFDERRRTDAPPAELLPIVGSIVNDDRDFIGGLMLYVRDGRLYDLEVFSYTSEPQPTPDPAQVRWEVDH
jgi:hypothetical protein